MAALSAATPMLLVLPAELAGSLALLLGVFLTPSRSTDSVSACALRAADAHLATLGWLGRARTLLLTRLPKTVVMGLVGLSLRATVIRVSHGISSEGMANPAVARLTR